MGINDIKSESVTLKIKPGIDDVNDHPSEQSVRDMVTTEVRAMILARGTRAGRGVNF